MSGERRHGGADQLDLFDEALKQARRHGAPGDGGTGAGTRVEPQALAASDRQPALTQDLMERVASAANLNQAGKRVTANHGASGVDGMTIDGLPPGLADHKDTAVAHGAAGHRAQERRAHEATGAADHQAQPGHRPGTHDRRAQPLRVGLGELLAIHRRPLPAAPPGQLVAAAAAPRSSQAAQGRRGHRPIPAPPRHLGSAGPAGGLVRHGLVAQGRQPSGRRRHVHHVASRSRLDGVGREVRCVAPPTATAVYGPVCSVVWQGRSREAPRYPDWAIGLDPCNLVL